MKRWLALSVILLLLAALAASAQEPAQPQKPQLLKINKNLQRLDIKPASPPKSPPPSGPAPEIFCDQPVYDFGTVPQGQEVKHTFVIKNRGKGVLKIESARGG